MKTRRCLPALTASLAMCALLGTGGLAGAAARHYTPPPDSYLRYSVYSVPQLINELETDPAVRERYAKHFQIPEDQVVSYMRQNLVESYIPRTKVYTVYCITRSGRIFPLHQRFARGTKVFALRNGQPVLKWICGNPLSRFLPTVITKTVVPPVTKVAPYLQELTPAENENVLVPNEALAPAYAPMIPLAAGGAASQLVSSGVSSLLPALYILPAALLFSNSGHGGSSTPPPILPPAIPESSPSELLLLGAPLALLPLAQRRRRIRAARSSR